MLILLPPSEGKTPPASGEPFDPEALSFPELTKPRQEVLRALARASAAPDALKRLGVGASLAQEVSRNITLHREPSAPAHQIYTGVLYEALSFSTMTRIQKARAAKSVLVISALWGAVGFSERIPAYRLSMSAPLPGVGGLAAFWKTRLTPVLNHHAAEGLIVDCRSSTYAAAWTPPPSRTVAVNVFRERDGKRTVVSHFAKHTRGELARHLLTRRGKEPALPGQLADIAAERWRAELLASEGRKPYQLNIILD